MGYPHFSYFTCLIGRAGWLPKKNEPEVCDDCLMGLTWEGRCATKGGGALSRGVVGKPNILVSSLVGENLLVGYCCRLIGGSTPPLPSGTPLNSLSPAV